MQGKYRNVRCERGDLNPHDGSLWPLRSEGKTKNPANTVLPIFGDDHSGHSGPCDRYRVPVLVWVPVGAQAVEVTLPGVHSGDLVQA